MRGSFIPFQLYNDELFWCSNLGLDVPVQIYVKILFPDERLTNCLSSRLYGEYKAVCPRLTIEYYNSNPLFFTSYYWKRL